MGRTCATGVPGGGGTVVGRPPLRPLKGPQRAASNAIRHPPAPDGLCAPGKLTGKGEAHPSCAPAASQRARARVRAYAHAHAHTHTHSLGPSPFQSRTRTTAEKALRTAPRSPTHTGLPLPASWGRLTRSCTAAPRWRRCRWWRPSRSQCRRARWALRACVRACVHATAIAAPPRARRHLFTYGGAPAC